MKKSIILGAVVAVIMPAMAIAGPSFQPAAADLVFAEQAAPATALETPRDAAPLVIVRENESRRGRGRGQP